MTRKNTVIICLVILVLYFVILRRDSSGLWNFEVSQKSESPQNLSNAMLSDRGNQRKTCSEIKKILGSLPNEQKNALRYFTQGILTSATSHVGYVLYGDKPMCIAAINEFSRIPNPMPSDFEDIIGMNGFEFLKELNISPNDKKYPFVECKTGGLRHFIFINRNRFVEVVNKNISLFRYILGRTLTAESFLEELLKSGNGFYDVFNWNKLVLGILLGYGTQNALIVSREEDLLCQLNDTRMFFPFDTYENFIAFQQSPSLGFSTVDEELGFLQSSFQSSTEIKYFDYCPIPHFGCDPGLIETTNLLHVYERNRMDIIKVVEEENVLSNFIERLCTTVLDQVSPPSVLPLKNSISDFNDNQIMQKFADSVALHVLDECECDSHFKKEALIGSFLKGIKHNQKGGSCEDPEWWRQSFGSDRKYYRYAYMNEAQKLLLEVATQNDVVTLLPNYIYYKVLLAGKGLPSTNNTKNATFNFTLFLDDGTFLDCGSLKKVDLDKLIPGIAYSIIGMTKGEVREVHIHPKYGYGWPLHPSAVLIKAQLKLLDFEDGERVYAFPILDEAMDGELDKFLKDYKRAKGFSYFRAGYHFANIIKELGRELNLDEFSERLKSKSVLQSFKNEDERKKFILDFNCHLFMRGYQGGRAPLDF